MRSLFNIRLLFLILIFFSMGTLQAHGSIVDELRSKISTKNQEIERIQEEIKKFEGEIAKTQGEARTLANAIEELKIAQRKIEAEINVTDKKIEAANFTIERLNLEIKSTENRIDISLEGIAESIRELSLEGDQGLVEVVLSNDELSDAWNKAESMRQLQSGIGEKLEELKESRTFLFSRKSELLGQRAKLLDLETELNSRKQVAVTNKRNQEKLLGETKSKESAYKNMLAERQALKKQFETELRDFESQLNVHINPGSYPPAGKGVLSWPVASVHVTQKFGLTSSSRRLYASGTHNGVDFRAAPGTAIKAAADGVVKGTGNTDDTCPNASYGKWVLIEHPNGLSSLYGHLDVIRVSPGQKVARGEIVAFSGNTGYSTAPHLHMTLYATEGVRITQLPSKACSGAIYTVPLAPPDGYLDPLDYL